MEWSGRDKRKATDSGKNTVDVMQMHAPEGGNKARTFP